MTDTDRLIEKDRMQALCIQQLCIAQLRSAVVRSEVSGRGIELMVEFYGLGDCKFCVTWAMLREWEEPQLRYWLRDELSKHVEYLAMKKYLR